MSFWIKKVTYIQQHENESHKMTLINIWNTAKVQFYQCINLKLAWFYINLFTCMWSYQ